MNQQRKKINVLMVGPASSVKGGIRTVVKQYLAYNGWEKINLRYIPTHVEGSILKKSLFFMFQYAYLCISCLVQKTDIVHMHVSERGSFWRKMIILRTFRVLGTKTILHHHGAEFFPFYDKASEKNKNRIARTIAQADVNIVLSNHHFELMQRYFPQGKFKVLYNGIIPEEGIYNPNATGILFVGRLGERKGVYDLIAALSDLEDRLPSEVKIYFCGDGEEEKVKKLLDEKQLTHRTAHVGWCTKEQLCEIYKQTMLFVLPSYHEGLPMSLLEAMYGGIPCISTNVDGIPELIRHGINGLLVEPGNIEQIKTNLLQLVEKKELRKKLGREGHQTVIRHFLLNNHIDAIEMLYLELRR